jgi:chaperonin GroES
MTIKTEKSVADKLQPLGDRILVEPVESQDTNQSGIFIPDSAKEKPTEAIVRVLGTGKTDDAGKKVPFEVKIGDRVLTSRYGGTEVKLDRKEYRLLRTEDIFGVIG